MRPTSIRQSLLITLSSGYIRSIIQFIASVIVARLLTPTEFGIFSIAMILIIIADKLRDFGVATYIVQDGNLDQARLNSASGLNYLTSWLMAGLIAFLAEPAALFYGASGVREVMLLLSVNFIVLPIGAATFAYMRRKLLFQRIAVIQIAKTIVSAGSGVLLAYLGFSYMSLAWGYLLASIAGILLTWGLKPAGLKIRPSFTGWRPIIRFGSLSTANSLINAGGARIPDLVLGKLVSVEAVAFFARAHGLLALFQKLIGNSLRFAAMPHFAAQIRGNKDPLSTYLTAVSHLTAVGWPFFGMIAITAPILIPFLYGHQWQDSVALAQLLSVANLFSLPFAIQNQILVAKGRIGFVTWFSFITVTLRLLAILILARYGLVAAVAGYASTSILVSGVSYIVLRKIVGITAKDFLRSLWPSLIIFSFVLTAGVSAVIVTESLATPEVVKLLVILLGSFVAWLLGIRISGHPLRSELKNFATKMMKRLRHSERR
jgi:O-antigen/teichoic acid export membrane protein